MPLASAIFLTPGSSDDRKVLSYRSIIERLLCMDHAVNKVFEAAPTSFVIPSSSIPKFIVNSFDGYRARRACYRYIVSAIITKQQSAIDLVSLVSAIFTGFSGGSGYQPLAFEPIIQRLSLTDVSRQQHATTLHAFLVLSWFTHRSSICHQVSLSCVKIHWYV